MDFTENCAGPFEGGRMHGAEGGALKLRRIAEEIKECRKCGLAVSRTNTVPGEGNAENPDVMFIGEGPGADEDASGRPFVGRAGQLLTKMILAMGYSREDVFIANIVKCRPPNNRVPDSGEMVLCMPWLFEQISAVRPKCIVALGATALKGLTGRESVSITRERGVWTEFRGIPMLPTFHPSYLLRAPLAKKEAWEDLKSVLRFLGRPIPDNSGRVKSNMR